MISFPFLSFLKKGNKGGREKKVKTTDPDIPA